MNYKFRRIEILFFIIKYPILQSVFLNQKNQIIFPINLYDSAIIFLRAKLLANFRFLLIDFMSETSAYSPFLLFSLPEEPVKTGCFALTGGLEEHATPFSIDTLFGKNALLGSFVPNSKKDAAAFFKVPSPVYLCDEVTSTFAIGQILAKKGLLPAWGAVLASTQTAGRGQYHRQWQSPRGNLYVTFRLPDVPLFQTNSAALIIGILLAKAFNRLGFSLKLKWPNDLLNPDDTKAAGILVENRGGVLLAGLGVNLHTLPDKEQLRQDHAIPAGLLQASNTTSFAFTPFTLWQALVNETIFAYSQSFASTITKTLPELVHSILAWKEEIVTISDAGNITFKGRLRGISPAGGLLLQTSNGETHEIYRGSLARA